MHQAHHREGFNRIEQQRPDRNREFAKHRRMVEDKGDSLRFEYSQAILELLKDPVSMGMQGANGGRGRQR